MHGAHALADGGEQPQHLRLGQVLARGRPRRQVVVQCTALGAELGRDQHLLVQGGHPDFRQSLSNAQMCMKNYSRPQGAEKLAE